MTYFDKKTGEKVEIINEDVNFYTLNNGIRIKKDIFYNKYEEHVEVNPDDFFKPASVSNDPLLNLANQLKNMDTSKISDNSEGTKIKYVPPVVISDTSMPNRPVQKQQVEQPIQLTPEEKKAMLDEWRRTQPGAQIPEVQERNWDDRFDTEVKEKPIVKEEPKVDPVKMMFGLFKNNYPVKLNLEIEENIPQPVLIGQIQENIEVDAIDYYSEIIVNKLIKDPSKLKTEIYNQLKKIIET